MTFEPGEQSGQVIIVPPDIYIPRDELTFRTSRSSGPGGQHVNKVETRVELLFDIATSVAFTEEQRARLLENLRSWIDDSGVLHIISDRYRSQFRNREDTLARLVTMLQRALIPPKPRVPTRTPRSVKEKRLQAKKTRGSVKRLRGRAWDEE